TDYVKVIVRPYIEAKIKGDSIPCRGFRQMLRADVTGGDSQKYWYSWRTVGPNVVISTRDSVLVSPVNTTIYRLVVGDSCSDRTDTAFFTINVRTILAAIPGADTTICKGNSAMLTVSGNGCNPQYYKFTWYKQGDPALLGTGSSLIVNPTATTVYEVILRDTTALLADTAVVKVTVDNVFSTSVTKDTTICQGQSLHLEATTISCDTSQVEYTWDNGLGTGKTKTISPGATATYTVVSRNLFNGLTDTAKVTVTVRPPLDITLNTDTTICVGETAQLRATVTGGWLSQHKIRWTIDNGLWTDSAAILTVSPSSTTSYTAALTDGCTTEPDSAKITVTVRPPLQTTVNPDTTICIGETAQLRATIAGGYIPGHTVLWTADNSSWTSNQLSIPVNPDTTTVYKARLTDGCTVYPDSAEITVTVRPPLKISVNADTTICTGQQAELRTLAAGGHVPGHQLEWRTDSSPWTSGQPTVTVSPDSTTVYTVKLTDNCTHTPDSALVTVTVRPPLQVTITAKDSICQHEVLLLTANVSGGHSPNRQILWSTDTGPWTNTLNPATDTPQTTTLYTATLSDNCSPSVQATKTITVLPVPKADFAVNPFEGCRPLAVIFTDLSTGHDTLQNSWKAETIEALGVTQYSHLFVQPGKYNVGLTVSNALGCTDHILKTNAVTVFEKPTADFVVRPDIKEIESPVYLYNQSRNASQYTWDMGDGNVIYQNHKNDTVYRYTDTGNLVIRLIAQNAQGCLDTTEQTIRVFDKINCVIPTAFTPGTSDNLNPVFAPVCTGMAQYTLTIYNRWGQIIFNCENCAWDGTFDSTPVPSGVYTYQINIVGDSYKKSTIFGMVNIIR
ncbi:MAG TPA: PKD domain-containing protein, partial [Bacteroidia bacterium]|nr:PKD domain-containing protein [Bacteroidia bacterium]